MLIDQRRTSHSFPITVVYLPESGNIQVLRKTGRPFSIEVSPDPKDDNGHASLYNALLGVFLETDISLG